MTFEELGLHDDVLNALGYMNFEKATPIQEQAIPEILKGKDLIACAQTGTGKTAAFILPIIDKLVTRPHKGTNTLVIVPTRELAIQIDQQIQGFSYFTPVHSQTVYGGGDGGGYINEKKALELGVDIVVATPGKLKSHITMGLTNFDHLEHLILDEADRMMDMGFIDDIMQIIKALPKKRQNLMFSATMPPKIRRLVKEILHEPVEINLALSKPAEGVTQQVYLAHDEQKSPLINRVLKAHPEFTSTLIFSSTKKNVFNIVRSLRNQGFQVQGISSDLEQKEREQVLSDFRSRKTPVLVATDVLSRGIDIKDINLVVNYDAPGNAEDYVHRVGRTARSDTKGMAITLVNGKDMRKLVDIESLIGYEIERLPLPEDLGPPPEWRDFTKRTKKKPFRKRNGKGKKPFHKNRKQQAKGKQAPPKNSNTRRQ
jgi:superfamily II DNA/RNA helicase